MTFISRSYIRCIVRVNANNSLVKNKSDDLHSVFRNSITFTTLCFFLNRICDQEKKKQFFSGCLTAKRKLTICRIVGFKIYLNFSQAPTLIDKRCEVKSVNPAFFFLIKYPHFLKISNQSLSTFFKVDYYKTIAKLNVKTIVHQRHNNKCIIICTIIDHNLF